MFPNRKLIEYSRNRIENANNHNRFLKLKLTVHEFKTFCDSSFKFGATSESLSSGTD